MMGIQKSLTTAYGVPAIHWNITNVTIDYVNQNVHVKLEGRNTKGATAPIATREYDIGTVNLTKTNGLARDITTYLLTATVPAVTLDDGTIIPEHGLTEFYQSPEET
jgi:hypothetical protein